VVVVSGAGDVVDPGSSHVAISRELPQALAEGGASDPDPESLTVYFASAAAPDALRVDTLRADGSLLDSLGDAHWRKLACPSVVGQGDCWATEPLRLSADRLDRDYPAARARSLEVELGGQFRVEAASGVLAAFRVGGPRQGAIAKFERLRAKLRVRVLRSAAGAPPVVGGDVAGATLSLRAEVQTAAKLWAQCGIDFGAVNALDIQVVDPPPPALIAVGCDSGLPASGGKISLRVAGRRVRIVTHAGELPDVVAERLAGALRSAGTGAFVSPNPRIASGASGSVDVLLRSSPGRPVQLRADPEQPLSTDKTLGVCLGEVDLSDGLSHFVEADAAAGTVEERALIKAFDTGDKSIIDVFVVPFFDESGRIGESFIDDDVHASIRNTVIIDRAAIRAGARSYALAHEIGHVLLGMPGHPDDYGVDQSSSLMDADAADSSVFGPRRLSLSECERALRESGPASRSPLLSVPAAKPPLTSGR